jgi:hypothetical protein
MWWFILFFALLIPLAAIVLDSQLGRALAALVESWGRSGEAIPDRRIAALEGELERVGQELRRLEEQTDFLQRLLTERHTTSGALESGDTGE